MAGWITGLLIRPGGDNLAYDTNTGISKMAAVLSERMKVENASPLSLDFGGIEADYSLTTNTFPVPIPRQSYMVCRGLSGLSLSASGGTHGGHESGDGSHSHSASMPMLSPGDRVLVAWVQNVPVVVDVIVRI